MSVVYVTLFQCVHLSSSGVIYIVIYSVIVNRPHANVDAKSLILGEDSSEFYHSRGPLTSACVQVSRTPASQNHQERQTKEIPSPKYKSARKHENKPGFTALFS